MNDVFSVKQSTCSLLVAYVSHEGITPMMVGTTMARYMAIALPDSKEWHPTISSILNPNDFSPIDAEAALIFALMWLEVIWAIGGT